MILFIANSLSAQEMEYPKAAYKLMSDELLHAISAINNKDIRYFEILSIKFSLFETRWTEKSKIENIELQAECTKAIRGFIIAPVCSILPPENTKKSCLSKSIFSEFKQNYLDCQALADES